MPITTHSQLQAGVTGIGVAVACACIVSVATYIPSNVIDVDLSQSEELFIKTKDMPGACKPILTVHLLCCAAKNSNDEKNDHVSYPIDKLHNLVLNNASTKYVFLKDIDFISSSNIITNNKYELVISEFEYNKDVSSVNNINNYPVNNICKTELIATQLQTGKSKTCHGSANNSKWFNKETENTDYYTAHYQLYCESWVIVRTDGYLTRHDERFNGYRFNKIVYTEGVNVLNNEFVLLLLYKIKRFYFKNCRSQNARKRRQRTKLVGSIVQTSDEWLFGCLCLCFAVVLCSVGSGQTDHMW